MTQISSNSNLVFGYLFDEILPTIKINFENMHEPQNLDALKLKKILKNFKFRRPTFKANRWIENHAFKLKALQVRYLSSQWNIWIFFDALIYLIFSFRLNKQKKKTGYFWKQIFVKSNWCIFFIIFRRFSS